MTTPTVARPTQTQSAHWYDLSGLPVFEVKKADGIGMRKTTLADARKQNLLPSVTGILKLLDKPGLNLWKQEQVALAVLTTPRKEAEADDVFVKRVLHEEEQHEQEARQAADLGKEIHSAFESYFSGDEVPAAMETYVRKAIERILAFGQKISPEVILVGDGYAGTTDLIQDCEDHWRIGDIKSAKNLPDPTKGGAWFEHRLQLAAYARAFQDRLKGAGEELKPIIPYNIYVSTTSPGLFVVCEHEDWESAYERGFAPLVSIWQYANRYRPNNPKRIQSESDQIPLEAQLAEISKENGRLKSEIEQLRANTVPQPAAPTVEAEETPEVPKGPIPVQQAAERPMAQGVARGANMPRTIGGKKVAWTPGNVTTAVQPQKE